jgi:hypothetical protein
MDGWKEGTVMTEKAQVLNMLKEEFDRWEEFLSSSSQEQITTRDLPGNRSIKDIVAHLWAWQQRSRARIEAARFNREPIFPVWSPGLDPNADEDLDAVNAWIFENNRERSWESVHQDWKEGFLHFLKLGEAVPEEDLQQIGIYLWMESYPLIMILESSYEHHIDHLEPLLARFNQPGDLKRSA